MAGPFVTTVDPANISSVCALTSSVVCTSAQIVKATGGRFFGYTSGAVATNAAAINITDGVGGTLLDFIPANCPANTQHLLVTGGIPFVNSLNIAGATNGPTITVYFS